MSFGPAVGLFAASSLPVMATSLDVFKAAALSIAVTLVVGPNASMLCRTWCDQQAVIASGCHHEKPTTSPGLAGDDCCRNMVLGTAGVVPRAVSAPDVDHAIWTSRFQIAPSTRDPRPGQEPGREGSLERRPLSTVLRI